MTFPTHLFGTLPQGRRLGLIAGLALIAAGLARPGRAQITIDLTTGPDNALFVAGQARPGATTNPVRNSGGVISYFYTNSWIEVPFTVESPGLYQLTIPVASTEVDLKAQIHVRAENSDVFWASDSFPVPTTGDWGSFQDATVADIPILEAGPHILRFANTKLQHSTADTRETTYEKDTGDQGPDTGVPRGSGFNVGILTLTRTGDLPAGTGTIQGTVTSPDAGIAVADAYVMAVTGDPVGEPGPWWQKGFWTTTDGNGAFTLPVVAGTYTVQAGQPSMYALAGATVANVAVEAGKTQTVAPQLASRWTKTEDGKHTVQVETEYFIAKNPDAFSTSPGAYQPSPVTLQGRLIDSNGFNVGYVDIGNYVDIPVDVPAGQGGDYIVEDVYFNGYWNGTDYLDAITKLSTGGNSIQATEPNTTPKDAFDTYVGPPDTGYTVVGRVTFADPLPLKEGHNVIRVSSEGTPGTNASAAWDALVFTQQNVPVVAAGAARALKVAAGLEPAPGAGADFDALNAATSGDSATRIDLLDALALARQGKL